MFDIAIRVRNLSKRYTIGRTRRRHDTLRDAISSTFQRSNVQRSNVQPFWALQDVSFEVRRGEVVGIIGRNGAGKSTLLKILSRITEPTQGRVEIFGRVGSLLEVGTGFHPELTGRENIYLNGAILGMRRAEIERKFDEIVDFSEIEQFLDTPVKRYSSGMYVRLAFAVAAHLDPEILLVDEVLAVGDVAFQKKCLGKMADVAYGGRTVLFVSHNMGAVGSLCERVLLLDSGTAAFDGSAAVAIERYYSNLIQSTAASGRVMWDEDNAPGSDGFRLRSVELVASDSAVQSSFTPQEPINVRIAYQLNKPLMGIRIVLQVRTTMGEIAFTSTDHMLRAEEHSQCGEYSSICTIPGQLLNVGEYVVRLWVGVPGVSRLLEPTDFVRFSVIGHGNHGSFYEDSTKWPGVVCPNLEWQIMARLQ